jgi:hypothetical protein
MWHGWTSVAQADAYETFLREEVVRGIAARLSVGFHSIDAVRAFAGPDYEQAVILPTARRLLARFDDRATHFEVRIPGPAHRHAT